MRKSRDDRESVLIACNFTPVPRHDFQVGAPRAGFWKELLNSDSPLYGGSGQGNLGGLYTEPVGTHGRPCSLNLTLPPLGIVFLKG
jgi:1,4-alpha-glucan branching enzyme